MGGNFKMIMSGVLFTIGAVIAIAVVVPLLSILSQVIFIIFSEYASEILSIIIPILILLFFIAII